MKLAESRHFLFFVLVKRMTKKSLAIKRSGVEDTTFEAKDKKNPRPKTEFSRTDPLKAKESNGQSQGSRTQFF